MAPPAVPFADLPWLNQVMEKTRICQLEETVGSRLAAAAASGTAPMCPCSGAQRYPLPSLQRS